MSAATLDALRISPLSLTLRDDLLDCPRRGRSRAAACDRCRYLLGSLDAADQTILCGSDEPRMAIVRPAEGMHDEPLIFDMDWPDI